MDLLKIRAFEDDDILLMKTWLNKEHVMKWYEDPDAWLSEIYGRFDKFSFINHFIALYDRNPIGFCQYYICADADEHWYGNIPITGSYSIDYLIGEENYLGKGFGKAIIALLVNKVFSLDKAQRIIVFPEPENIASCKSLLANGFIFDEKNKLYCKTK
ncbi:aminoglycoside N(6')-acetyltransferase type 1 [Oxobacter pfennigii]|uniref:Aminoglycoside N(6')-acetyltransferase type 1 n=1 Tax=Oxobacter pfennigii TaxID=36849 RepID=A0A0P8WB36_9CLOT|nr:GNAT family N-acetyltransferase [Oxobacter pfennigii]KPU45853.1 aminoglycoside N(6')-acetyltransferase type 1 [Oxobacter pfennigii]